jgi:two-component system phosphate regulon sensor histidine kinase PhoR
MRIPIAVRLFLSCFVLTTVMVLAVDFSLASGPGNVAIRRIFELVACLCAAGLMAWIFARALAWRIGRIKSFADHVLDASPENAPLPDEGEETAALNASLHRMGSRIRELVDRLSMESARRDAILSSMAEGVLAVNRQLQVVFCNGALLSALGLRRMVSEGMPVQDLIRDPGFLDMIAEVLEKGHPVTSKLQLPGKEISVFEAYAAPLAMPPDRGALLILHDITGLERLERVRRDFVANVSHELRTPLTAIRGYAETLLDGALEDMDNNRHFVEIIQAHAIRLNNIASDLLTLSDLESGRLDAEGGSIAVDDAVNTAYLTVEAEAKIRGVRLVRGEPTDLRVTGHALRLEQVLVNLLDNAVKFNHQGGEARIGGGMTGDGHVFVSVSDNGSGIPSDDLPRIFERFYRVDKARSRAVGGTGLGLSIVKHVVERMGGTIKVDSRLGRGSTFTILFPAAGQTTASDGLPIGSRSSY